MIRRSLVAPTIERPRVDILDVKGSMWRGKVRFDVNTKGVKAVVSAT